MKSFLPLMLLGFAILFWPEGKTPSPEPNPDGPIEIRTTDTADVTAVKMRAMWRRGTAKAAFAIADGIDAGTFQSELAEIQEFERTSNDIAKEAVQGGSAWWAAAYAETRKLPADQQKKARAEFWRSFGKGVLQ